MSSGPSAATGVQREEVDALIVGAGFAGIGLGIRLARRRDTSFVIVERADAIGGTWRDNIYPGVACDIPSHLYSFSFRTKPDWSHVYPSGEEIRSYLVEAAREEDLGAHLRLNSDVLEARWDDHDARWDVETTTGSFRARILVSAVGRLSEPKISDIPGLAGFPGAVFHTAHWDHNTPADGARIGVVGTGASAVQVVPILAESAAELVVFQRSAPYIVPRNDRAYTDEEKALFTRDPSESDRLRDRLFWDAEAGFPARQGEAEAIEELRDRARQHLEMQVSGAKLRRALTPDYEIGCKRILLSDDYYPALTRSNVTLEDSPVVSVEGSIVIAASGAHHQLDTLVLATGFQSTRPPFAERVAGRNATRLSEHWSRGMTAYASTAVHGFPNFFVIDGPNASLSHNSAVYMIETQIDYVLGAIDHVGTDGRSILEVTQEAEDAYTRRLDEAASGMVWITGGCRNWYVDEDSGRLTLLWPGYAHTFRETNGTFDPAPYLLTPRNFGLEDAAHGR